MLMIVTKSLTNLSETDLSSLRAAKGDDAVVLMSDALYLPADLIGSARIYALDKQRSSRGLAQNTAIRYIDISDFVDLTEHHEQSITL